MMIEAPLPVERTDRIVRPHDSRFGIVHEKNSLHVVGVDGTRLFAIAGDGGAYVYACLRGQERIEQSLKEHPRGAFSKERFMSDIARSGYFSESEMQALWEQVRETYEHVVGGSDPTVTKRPLYMTAGEFVRTEHDKPEGSDVLPRMKSRSEDCHIAAREFMHYAGLEPISTELFLSTVTGYDELARVVGRHSLPQLLEIFSRDMKVKKDALSRIHSFIVLGRAGEEYVCFEKVGTALAWRLAPLKEIFEMYEEHFKRANENRLQISWAVSTLEPR